MVPPTPAGSNHEDRKELTHCSASSIHAEERAKRKKRPIVLMVRISPEFARVAMGLVVKSEVS